MTAAAKSQHTLTDEQLARVDAARGALDMLNAAGAAWDVLDVVRVAQYIETGITS